MVEAVLRQHILGVDGVLSISAFRLRIRPDDAAGDRGVPGETAAGTANGTVSVGV